jgi:hypothetical protein
MAYLRITDSTPPTPDNQSTSHRARQVVRPLKIGEILVEQGVLTASQVEAILAEQRSSMRPFGDLAERMFGVSANAVEEAWVTQYIRTVGTTDLGSIRLDISCLRVLSRRQAWQFHLLPLNREDGVGGALSLATDERNVVRALNFATRSIDDVVHLVVAERWQLREFLMKHYPVPRELAEYSDRLTTREPHLTAV